MKTMHKLAAVLLLIVLLASCTPSGMVSDELYERYTHPTDYYPRYAEPYSEFVVDAEGNWSFETGRFYTKQELAEHEAGPLGESDLFVEDPEGKGITKLQPNTEANYDLHGFIVDIMYFYDGRYHLAPQFATGE